MYVACAVEVEIHQYVLSMSTWQFVSIFGLTAHFYTQMRAISSAFSTAPTTQNTILGLDFRTQF